MSVVVKVCSYPAAVGVYAVASSPFACEAGEAACQVAAQAYAEGMSLRYSIQVGIACQYLGEVGPEWRCRVDFTLRTMDAAGLVELKRDVEDLVPRALGGA